MSLEVAPSRPKIETLWEFQAFRADLFGAANGLCETQTGLLDRSAQKLFHSAVPL